MPNDQILEVSGLTTHFFVPGGVVRAVDDVDITVAREEIVTIVGESGSGKSVTAMSIIGLIEKPGRILSGEVRFLGRDLLKLSRRDMQSVRGKGISMVFQNPYTSLHPGMKIGHQMVESIIYHEHIEMHEARRRAIDMLERIGVEDASGSFERYPFEVSAGVSQRVMLAIALALRPSLLIADEPTTNLDAISQVQFLQLVKDMRDEMNMSVLIITHDFGVVSMMSDRVVVMYAGKQVESGSADQVLHHPQHPYSAALLNSVRMLSNSRYSERLEQIPGEVPDVMRLPPGCGFRERCTKAMDVCREAPPRVVMSENRMARCWLLQGN
jgi:oligopeptide transport system ATP-binding protein